jgi:hypothetical protein
MTDKPDETTEVPGEDTIEEPTEYNAPPTDDDGPQDDVEDPA